MFLNRLKAAAFLRLVKANRAIAAVDARHGAAATWPLVEVERGFDVGDVRAAAIALAKVEARRRGDAAKTLRKRCMFTVKSWF